MCKKCKCNPERIASAFVWWLNSERNTSIGIITIAVSLGLCGPDHDSDSQGEMNAKTRVSGALLCTVTAHRNSHLREMNPHNKLFQTETANKPKAASEDWQRNRNGRFLHRMPADQPDANNDLPHMYGKKPNMYQL